jgi:hypothetical protein
MVADHRITGSPDHRITGSRGLALTCAIVCSLTVVLYLYMLTIEIRDGDAWPIVIRVGRIFAFGALATVWWTNWRKLRPAE